MRNCWVLPVLLLQPSFVWLKGSGGKREITRRSLHPIKSCDLTRIIPVSATQSIAVIGLTQSACSIAHK